MPPRRIEAEHREVEGGVDGVACRVAKYENRTLVQVDTQSATRYKFDLKSASWEDDEEIRKQARAHKKWAGLAPARDPGSSEAAAAAGVSDESQSQVPAVGRQSCSCAGQNASGRYTRLAAANGRAA